MQNASTDRPWVVAAALCAALALIGCPSRQQDGEGADKGSEHASLAHPKLIVLISIDTLRADHLSLYGHERFTSPTLDGFAAGGVVFEDANSTSPWTAPAHASMLTGLYPLRHRVLTFDTALPAEIPTLAGILESAGYRTAAVVNSAWLKRERYGITRDFQNYQFVDDAQDRRAPNTWVTDQAIEWIRERGEDPLFLFVHYYDVHSDYSSLPEFERLFVTPYAGEADGTGWQLARASFDDDYLAMCHENYDPDRCRLGNVENYLAIDRSVGKLFFDADDLRHIEELYDAGIRQFDNELGRFLSLIGSEGILDDALVLITSDHGEEFMDHGRMDHFLTMYQEILRVPLVIRGPNVPPGLRVDTPVSLIDIAPTLLSLAGIRSDTRMDGLDLTQLFDIAKKPPEEFRDRMLFGEASGGLTYALMMKDIYPVYRSIRRGPHKLIHNSKENAWELYDLAQDPGEKVNIFAEQGGVATELVGAMEARYREFDPQPDTENQVELSRQELEKLRALGYLP